MAVKLITRNPLDSLGIVPADFIPSAQVVVNKFFSEPSSLQKYTQWQYNKNQDLVPKEQKNYIAK